MFFESLRSSDFELAYIIWHIAIIQNNIHTYLDRVQIVKIIVK